MSELDVFVGADLVKLSLITLTESEVTKKLAAWTAIIAVPTMIADIHGMNFEHIPQLDQWFGYPLSVVVMLGLDVWLSPRFRRVKWL